MFEQWKQAWHEAVRNFWKELDGAGTPAERAQAMRRDVSAARAELERVEAELGRARAQAAEEREAEQSCRRREALAREIGDDETARIAAEYGARHAERAGVLEQKVRALEAELALRRRDVDEMQAALRTAEAAAGEVGAVGGAGGGSVSGDPLTEEDAARDREFRRMEREAREQEAERRLEELKRRMR